MIIELAGIPRSGKSTFANQFKDEFSIFEEFFDEVPFEWDEHDKYNTWYVNKLHELVVRVHAETQDAIIQRGPFDRLVFATALYETNRISESALKTHQQVFEHCKNLVDKVIVCDCSVEKSLQRDKPTNKITGDREFLSILKDIYLQEAKKYGFRIIDTMQEEVKDIRKF